MDENMTFEQALTRLETIVRSLEQGNAPLDSALALFEEGTRLVRFCTQKLDVAEQKVRKITETPSGVSESEFES